MQEMYYENECESESESKSTKYNEKVKCNFASMPIGEKLLWESMLRKKYWGLEYSWWTEHIQFFFYLYKNTVNIFNNLCLI